VFIRTHGVDAFRKRLADHYKIDLTMGEQRPAGKQNR